MTDLDTAMAGGWASTLPGHRPNKTLIVPTIAWDGAKVGKCYNNVQAMISRHGGEFAYGWALTDFGPHRVVPKADPSPLYRRWLNHVVWRDAHGELWEVSPNAVVDDHSQRNFVATEFLPDADATFEIRTDDEWLTRPTRYMPLRSEGVPVTNLLDKVQHATDSATRNHWLREALLALQTAGFRPREWKVETIGNRTGSIWLIAE